jgi:hypothetical protein
MGHICCLVNKKILGISINICAWSCAVLGIWGLLYPELTMTTDVCRVVDESGKAVSDVSVRQGYELYRDILNADKGHVRVKSRLYEILLNQE